MALSGSVKKLSVFIGDADTYEDGPLYEAMLEQARVQGCSGATVLRGVAGYGATSRKVEKHGMKMSVDLPLVRDALNDVDSTLTVGSIAAILAALLVELARVHLGIKSGQLDCGYLQVIRLAIRSVRPQQQALNSVILALGSKQA